MFTLCIICYSGRQNIDHYLLSLCDYKNTAKSSFQGRELLSIFDMRKTRFMIILLYHISKEIVIVIVMMMMIFKSNCNCKRGQCKVIVIVIYYFQKLLTPCRMSGHLEKQSGTMKNGIHLQLASNKLVYIWQKIIKILNS